MHVIQSIVNVELRRFRKIAVRKVNAGQRMLRVPWTWRNFAAGGNPESSKLGRDHTGNRSVLGPPI